MTTAAAPGTPVASDPPDSPEHRARRFLDSCADIEKILRDRYSLTQTGFGTVVRAVEDKDPLVKQNAVALRAFAELRNVLSHTAYRHGEPVAAPLASTVRAIERFREQVKRPLPALGFAVRDVLTANAGDALPGLLRRMVADDISQVPVYATDGSVRLLTTNAIARWVAAHIEHDGSVLIESSTTEDALAYAEPHERVKLIKRNTPAATALQQLTSAAPPAAVLITEQGRAGEDPLGILSGTDVPRLVQDLTVHAY